VTAGDQQIDASLRCTDSHPFEPLKLFAKMLFDEVRKERLGLDCDNPRSDLDQRSAAASHMSADVEDKLSWRDEGAVEALQPKAPPRLSVINDERPSKTER
jgi:hypothetical protein